VLDLPSNNDYPNASTAFLYDDWSNASETSNGNITFADSTSSIQRSFDGRRSQSDFVNFDNSENNVQTPFLVDEFPHGYRREISPSLGPDLGFQYPSQTYPGRRLAQFNNTGFTIPAANEVDDDLELDKQIA
jgi:hypothetical protein